MIVLNVGCCDGCIMSAFVTMGVFKLYCIILNYFSTYREKKRKREDIRKNVRDAILVSCIFTAFKTRSSALL